jgi:hypothetical protein
VVDLDLRAGDEETSMTTFLLFLLVGLSILGIVHTYRLAFRLNKMKEETGRSTESMIFRGDLSPLDLTCMLFFGYIVILILKITKALGIRK